MVITKKCVTRVAVVYRLCTGCSHARVQHLTGVGTKQRHYSDALADHKMNPGIWNRGVFCLNTVNMAEKHTISVIGLLKEVEFHMAKGAAEVHLNCFLLLCRHRCRQEV